MDSIWFNSKTAGWGWLSNFSATPVTVAGRDYQSVEHCYQAAKFSPESAMFQTVCDAASSAAAKAEARDGASLEHWPAIRDHVMQAALSAKFAQHADLRDRLLATQGRPLVHESDQDLYWGRRRDGGEGKNRLGEMLMELRRDLGSRRSQPAEVPTAFPNSVVIHVPHDATFVPQSVRPQFQLDEHGLAKEIARLTDHRTLDLFTTFGDRHLVVRAPVSRLVVDTERFADDREELAGSGMGAVYEVTSDLALLRHPMDLVAREELLSRYYEPHHQALKTAVEAAIRRTGHCVILDAHSYPDARLPYEISSPGTRRPDICLGVDAFHTSHRLAKSFVESFAAAGWSTAVNEPFAGTMVPSCMLRTEDRVQSIMVEVNRRVYLRGVDEVVMDFDRLAATVRLCCVRAICAAVSGPSEDPRNRPA